MAAGRVEHVQVSPTAKAVLCRLSERLEHYTYSRRHERGTSAWCHRVLEAGDWLEVDALQCHFCSLICSSVQPAA